MQEKSYTLTREEFQHMALRLFYNEPSIRRRRLIFQIFLTLAAFAAYYMLSGIFPALIGAAILFLVLPFALRYGSRRAYSQTYDIQAKGPMGVTIQIAETHIRLWRTHLRSEIDWEAVTRIDEDEVGFYLGYGPLQTIFVPRRVFQSAAEAQEFWTLTQAYWEVARPANVSRTAPPREAKI